MRRHAGWVLVFIGVGLLGFVGSRYLGGWLARERVRAEWARLEAERARLAANARATVVDSGPVAPGTPVARLLVPRIALDEIVVEGVDAGELNVSPGHMPETPLPGAVGNAVVSAHRDLHFRRLGQLRVGDTLTTVTPGRTVTWRIVGRRIVDAEAPAIHQTTEPTLTLTTCWPIRFIGSAPDRLLLTAEPVHATPPSAALTASVEPRL
ncbi:MAG TPA: class D sortase [Gemmatimonadaceae bacterium]|nr:class D sortase [Gemmatimonadaceae bacterium]